MTAFCFRRPRLSRITNDIDQAFCVILDINLNDEVRDRAEASPQGRRNLLPVIYITANDSHAVRAAALESGCIAYLTKPFSAKSLIEPLEQASAGLVIGCRTAERLDIVTRRSPVRRLCVGVPCRTAANRSSGSEVLTVSTLESTTSSRRVLPALHILQQAGSAKSACDAGIRKAPDIRESIRRSLVDGDFDAGLQVQADGKEQLQPRRLVALALDQVDADGRLARLEGPADRCPAYHVGSGRLEADLLQSEYLISSPLRWPRGANS